ncbi:hypothetical protein QJS04_geneDACA018491 [Acorus gramineus]|uniref:DDT domain-containing protein n=1 Tax=Acorus gramineus TaxID=55184 RepID=A0AAV9B116_ACOGR|nr:hypothetical protein QJS04_geneDACA018491 [Acorus gramineus]
MGIANTDTIIEAKPQLEPKSPKLKKHVAKQSDLIFDEVVTKVGEKGVTIAETDNTAKAEPQLDPKVPRLKKNGIRSCTRIVDMNVVLPPQCIGLTTLVGVDLPTDDIGSALQFLEFCRAFEKALHIRKGLPESVLREIVSGRRVGRRGRKGSSSILQVHIKLLRHIQKANGQESTLKSSGNSWIKALGKCITDAEYPPKDVPMDFLEGGAAGYDKLDSSMKLRILNFLCDETLGTQDLRNWIDEENSKFDEIKKEANARVLEAKKREKLMKQMLKNEVAQTMISLRDGASLSINEHEALMSKVRSETEKALAEKLETINSVPKMKQRADAVRTEPIVLDDNGRAFWRLRGYSDGSYVMLQDVGDRESVIPQDKWFIYDEEHAKLIEQYISFLRKQRLAMHKVSLSSALQDDGMEE